MALEISTVQPDFILVMYDIKTTRVRDKVRFILQCAGSRRKNFSVYMMPYTPEGYQELKEIQARFEDDVDIKVYTPNFGSDAEMLRNEYEQAFMSDWEELEGILDRIDRMFTGDEVKVDDKTGEESEYTPSQIMGVIRHAEKLVDMLEQSLGKRKARELDADLQESFRKMEGRLRSMDARLAKQKLSVATRMKAQKGNAGVTA